jgi:hypothetical protein
MLTERFFIFNCNDVVDFRRVASRNDEACRSSRYKRNIHDSPTFLGAIAPNTGKVVLDINTKQDDMGNCPRGASPPETLSGMIEYVDRKPLFLAPLSRADRDRISAYLRDHRQSIEQAGDVLRPRSLAKRAAGVYLGDVPRPDR